MLDIKTIILLLNYVQYLCNKRMIQLSILTVAKVLIPQLLVTGHTVNAPRCKHAPWVNMDFNKGSVVHIRQPVAERVGDNRFTSSLSLSLTRYKERLCQQRQECH